MFLCLDRSHQKVIENALAIHLSQPSSWERKTPVMDLGWRTWCDLRLHTVIKYRWNVEHKCLPNQPTLQMLSYSFHQTQLWEGKLKVDAFPMKGHLHCQHNHQLGSLLGLCGRICSLKRASSLSSHANSTEVHSCTAALIGVGALTSLDPTSRFHRESFGKCPNKMTWEMCFLPGYIRFGLHSFYGWTVLTISRRSHRKLLSTTHASSASSQFIQIILMVSPREVLQCEPFVLKPLHFNQHWSVTNEVSLPLFSAGDALWKLQANWNETKTATVGHSSKKRVASHVCSTRVVAFHLL